jgi:two-component system, chemotaxis family, sensor kinase CheA
MNNPYFKDFVEQSKRGTLMSEDLDAVTLNALKSLKEDLGPRLIASATAAIDTNAAQPDQVMVLVINELNDLCNLLTRWTSQSEHNSESMQASSDQVKMTESEMTAPLDAALLTELSDDEAQMMLADMDGPVAAVPMTELSDDEAQMLLADMDGPVAPAPMTELSDDEAQMMLADMDGPVTATPPAEISDDQAHMMLADMDGPVAAAPPVEISDDQAHMMLADMDGPVAAAPPAELSDDQAEMMLTEMDAPATPQSSPDVSDDEAQRLLAEMDSSTAVDPESTFISPTPTDSSQNEQEESVDEIEEWIANEFQEDPTMIDDFNTNTAELMEALDKSILELEQDPTNKETIEEIFRAAHTLKGAAGMFGFKGLERVMHRTENLFDLIRKEKLNPTSEIIDVVLESQDIMKALLQAVLDGAPCGIKTAQIVDDLTAIAAGKSIQKATPNTPEPSTEAANAEQPKESAEVSIEDSSQVKQDASSTPKLAKAKKGAADVATIRVDLNRLDSLVNLVGELVIDRTRFNHIEEDLRTKTPQLNATGNMTETLQLFGRHMSEVQDIIMKIRMVPIGNAFNKFPRVVRDLARTLNKKIELKISGETAELDKTLVEQIGDPLIHLIRNSCDHGVEIPEDRLKQGKPEIGTINLSAKQEGNFIVVTIQDDGKGMPLEKLREKGIERGLISADDKLSDKEVFNLIFEPGFSTAEKVTEVSGRGVGMDVVKKQITKLKGSIVVDSKWGRGSTISINLPLTLAIVQSLLVRVSNETLAIPLTSVIESIRATKNDIKKIGDGDVIKLRNEILPLIHLDEVLNIGEVGEEHQSERDHITNGGQDKFYVVICGTAERKFGLVVTELLNQQEMVIKPLGPLMQNIPGISGGAVLGHGEVVLVLDTTDVLNGIKTFNNKNKLAA